MPPRKNESVDRHGQDGRRPINFGDNGDYNPPEKQGATSRLAGREAATTGATTHNKRSRVRTPDRLNAIPAEVFLEIASYLQPLDILHMARTNKAWRAILMSKCSRPIWQAAESSITELPDCPSDLNEPQYARLMFDKDCYECGGKNVAWTSFELRARLCQACTKGNLVPWDTLPQNWKITESPDSGAQVVEGPIVTVRNPNADRSVRLAELVPRCLGRPHTKSKRNHVFKPDLDRMLALMRVKAQCGSEGLAWAKSLRAAGVVIRRDAEKLKAFHASWRDGLRQQYDEAYRRRQEKQSK